MTADIHSLTKQKGRGPKRAKTAIPVVIEVDPHDNRNCFTQSWENYSHAVGRCPGIGTIGDSNKLVCEYFRTVDPTTMSIECEPGAMLYSPEGVGATWESSKPVRRCRACIVGEEIMNSKALVPK